MYARSVQAFTTKMRMDWYRPPHFGVGKNVTKKNLKKPYRSATR
jgi:hypothetical protein